MYNVQILGISVVEDIKDLALTIKIEDIQTMNKTSFKNILKKAIDQKAMEELELKKNQHSKVKHIKHSSLKLQKYLQPCRIKMTNEERRLIFKLRCRVTETKTNFKDVFDSYECDLCGQENESQQHILKCPELRIKEEELAEIPEYGKLFDGKLTDQLKLANIFK